MLFVTTLVPALIATALAVGRSNRQGQLGSSDVSELRVQRCAKCFYLEGGENMLQPLREALDMPENDHRCKWWNDRIPESAYEDCGEPFDGEANACLFLNMTLSMKNILTEILGGAGTAINDASDVVNGAVNDPLGTINDAIGGAIGVDPLGTVNDAVNNPVGTINDAAGNPLGTVDDAVGGSLGDVNDAVGSPIGAVNDAVGGALGTGNGDSGGFFGWGGAQAQTQSPTRRTRPPYVPRPSGGGFQGFGFGRKKRQANNYNRNYNNNNNNNNRFFNNPVGSAINQGTGAINSGVGGVAGAVGGAVGGAVNGAVTAIPGIDLGSFIPSHDGNYEYKLFYKGCVRLSILETLSGSHCRLQPDINDIQFFSQQALLQPMMDIVNKMNAGLSGFAGTKQQVDGLCYIVKKEFTKQVWKALMHYDPKWLEGM